VRGGGVYFVISIAGLEQTKERRGSTAPFILGPRCAFARKLLGCFWGVMA